MDTLEGNIMIAEYRGATVEQWYPENKLEKMSGRHVVYPKDHYPANEKHHHESMLLYHSDWNWLIPVVRQVQWDIKMEIDKDPYAILGNPEEKGLRVCRQKLENATLTLQIDKVWEATIQGITVLNNIKDGTTK